LRVLYFGTYERTYPRNAQVISALRGAGVEVVERHIPVWEGREHKFQAGLGVVGRLALAQLPLLRRPHDPFDVVVVGYPGQLDVGRARHVAGERPVVFNPLVSLADTFVEDRARFRAGSPAARALAWLDRRSFRSADLVVADTRAQAKLFRELGARRVDVCFVGAEERVFKPGWKPQEPFTALFVGKLIPLHGLETVLAAARLAPEIPFRVVGSGQLEALLEERPANVEWIRWVEYERLPAQLHACGCALGIFGTSAKAQRVIPNKVFQALACGAPVVTADTPAARELDEGAFRLVPPGDAQALAGAVRALAADAHEREALAARGHQTYLHRASEAILGRRWRALLEELL
jgi:glycosyltransferase involved in cell wall biosynthesis